MVPLTEVGSSIATGKVASVSCTTNVGSTCTVRDFTSSDTIFGVAFRYTPTGGSQLEAQLSGAVSFDASTEAPTFDSPAASANIRSDFRLQFRCVSGSLHLILSLYLSIYLYPYLFLASPLVRLREPLI